MKGITPIISTIVLLLITVALAGAAWVYISGFMGTYTEKSFVIPTGGAYCGSSGKFHARVVNTGITSINAADWVNANITNTTSDVPLGIQNVATKGTADFASADKQGVSGNVYTLIIGTVAGIQRLPVVCP